MTEARSAHQLTHLEAATVAAYLDRQLSSQETSRVESHLADCVACRAEVVQLRRLVPVDRGRRMRWAGFAAAAAVVLLLWRGNWLQTSGDDEIRALGAVAAAPSYIGVPVRETSDGGTSAFAAGMRAYVQGRHADAIAQLRLAQREQASGPAIPFFLGASLLLESRPAEAERELARVTALGASPYLAEAHYYRAKALLQLARADAALLQLDTLARLDDAPLRDAARALGDSIRAVQR